MKSVCKMLERSARLYPDKVAFSDPDDQITFSRLLTASRSIACRFLSEFVMSCGERSVLFFMEKCVKALPVMFGGVYAGAFYCFVDIRQSDERAIKIIQKVDPSVVVTDEANRVRLERMMPNLRYMMVEELFDRAVSDKDTLDEDALDRESLGYTDQRPLYVNFTSGSTGEPKGVVVGHASVIDFIEVFTKTFGINETDVIANQAPFDFDVSVKDIYSGLFTGATVRLIPRDYFSNPTLLMDYLCDGNVTVVIWAVTAMCFVSIMNGFDYKAPRNLRLVMFSGEIMPVKQLNKWKKYLPSATFVNLYGPTEITCNCTYHIIDREYAADENIPIGIPFENEKVFLLDDDDRLVTYPDIEGEICVAGTCLALGYYKDGATTSKAFVQNPVNDSYIEIIYRTGDLAKYDDSGLLYYTSRKDHQIKHMGQRIELADIEMSAMAVDGVSRACCIYDEKKKKIILFYTGDIDKTELSSELKSKLPEFMIPGKTQKLDQMPINKNGKIDRKALENVK